MSHHYSGPDFGFPHGDARLDLTDLYAFPAAGRAESSVLVMNVHPSSSIYPPASTVWEPFASDASYEIHVDTNGDNVAELVYRICFSEGRGGAQTAAVSRLQGADAQDAAAIGTPLFKSVPISLGRDARVIGTDLYRVFAGWRSDPFFFDPLGALNGFKFDGTDFFADKDVCSIVLEIPNTDLGQGRVGLWARTVDLRNGVRVQADRGAKPAQSVFLPGDEREAYLRSEPAQDSRFIDAFAHSLQHAGGYSLAEAREVAATLLPDVLNFDPGRPALYPENGRSLTDDVLDGFLAILTNGKVTTDRVGPHSDLLDEFPYLGPPHMDRSQVGTGRIDWTTADVGERT